MFTKKEKQGWAKVDKVFSILQDTLRYTPEQRAARQKWFEEVGERESSVETPFDHYARYGTEVF